jgi:hypothetical protein
MAPAALLFGAMTSSKFLVPAGIALLTGSEVIGGLAKAKEAEFQEELADRNAVAARRQAELDEVRTRRSQRRVAGRTTAQFGAAGITLMGTPLEVLADQALEQEENAMLVRFGGDIAAQRSRAKSEVYAFRRRGLLATTAGGGMGTLLGGISKAKRAGIYAERATTTGSTES